MRSRAAVGLLVIALTGCTVTSTPSNVKDMRCVEAHDEIHGSGVETICDRYEPLTKEGS